MKKHNLTKSVSIIFMLLAMMFACQPIDEDSTEANIASYEVVHYLQNIENDEFTSIVETESKKGEINSETKAEAKTYDGFTAKNITQKEILAKGHHPCRHHAEHRPPAPEGRFP